MADKLPFAEHQAACLTPVGWLAISATEVAVTRVEILENRPWLNGNGENTLANQAREALLNWFRGGDWPRFIAVEPEGTVFQHRVWKALLDIPPGQTRTYGALARELGSSPRAVGGACRSNPIPLLIPCHRVVAANGDGGFAGHTSGRWMDIKRWLLEHE